MTYDLMNRRDNVTNHHTSIEGSTRTIDRYIEHGMSPGKINLGLAFYAKYFTTQSGAKCLEPTGCATVVLEAADGSDTAKSGQLPLKLRTTIPIPTSLLSRRFKTAKRTPQRAVSGFGTTPPTCTGLGILLNLLRASSRKLW